MTTTTRTSFADTGTARVIAALLAFFIALVLFSNYREDFARLANNETAVSLPGTTNSSNNSASVNPELAACLEKRVADVNQMKEDGLLSDDQYGSFRSRAEELCVQQNPAQQ